jgi:hypothetical protein
MEHQVFDIRDFIGVTQLSPIGLPWPIACPFDLTFARRQLDAGRAAAITGTGIYLITKLPEREIVYLGLYRPMSGDIIADRWARHLQTVTWRGARIGLGPTTREPTPEKVQRRKDSLLKAIGHPSLQSVLHAAHNHDVEERFRSTGNDTSVNRARFATEHWDVFSNATAESILDNFAFDLIRMRLPADQETATRQIKAVEGRLLRSFKPICNKEFRVKAHGAMREGNNEDALVPAVRQVMFDVTGHYPTHRASLRPDV